jgi:hypothetical protein
MALPAPNAGSGSSCGTTNYTVQSFNGQNFAYVEMKNLTNSAATVSLSVDGPNPSSLSLFAYASPTPPSSNDNVNQCLVSAQGSFEHSGGNLTPVPPSLSVAAGKGVVVGPQASVFVMLATWDQTGPFRIKAHRP